MDEESAKHVGMLFDNAREMIILGDGTAGCSVSSCEYKDGTRYPAIGILKLSEPPEDLEKLPNYLTAQYCSVLIVLKNRRAISVLRTWVNAAEEIMDKIEKETK
jgi:hypothetical protein